jgi:integrase/recombinase XerD
VRTLERYLVATSLIASVRPETASSASILVEEYANYLHEVRGLASDTIAHRRHTAQWFLQHLDEEGITLKKIHRSHLDSYITRAGKRLCRTSLQHDISALRVFLRFLAMDGKAPAGLDSQIDTPRLYRLEQLPRTLPWETVSALLRSIDRTSAMGLRDYAMFLLIATYGLRISEVVVITVDDIHWSQNRLQIHQSKTSSPLELPLTNEVSTALVKHLKRIHPQSGGSPSVSGLRQEEETSRHLGHLLCRRPAHLRGHRTYSSRHRQQAHGYPYRAGEREER